MSYEKFKNLELRYISETGRDCYKTLGLPKENREGSRCNICASIHSEKHYQAVMKTWSFTCASITRVDEVMGKGFCATKSCFECKAILRKLLESNFKSKFNELKGRRDELRRI